MLDLQVPSPAVKPELPDPPAMPCLKRASCKLEVHCRQCTEYDPPALPAGRLLMFVHRSDYRARQTSFFALPWAEAGWQVVHVQADEAAPLYGVPALAAKHGMPDAIMQWDEHGVAFADKPWRDLIAWCDARDVLALALDFGYFGHYQHFMYDLYGSEGYSSIRDDWDALSDEPIDWDHQTEIVRDYCRRVLRGYAEARDKPPLLKEPYVAVFLQQHCTLSRLEPHSINEWMDHLAASLARHGLVAAFKTAPDAPEVRCPPGARLFLHGTLGSDLNQRLAVHARYCLVNCSSLTNEFLLNELPVVALGRSWFNQLDVFAEPEKWEAIPAEAPPINQPARNRYARWWLSRQFPSSDAGARLTEFYQQRRPWTGGERVRGTAITCVYAPDADTEAIVADCLETRAAAFKGWRRLIAFDDASPTLVLAAQRDGAICLAPDEGEPPRMGGILAAAIARAEGLHIFTVEHDVTIDEPNVERALAVLESLPNRVAALYLQSRDERGKPTYPWTADVGRAKPWADTEFREPQWPTLSCTLWRASALRQIDGRRLPALEFVDGTIGDQLRALGYVCLMTDEAHCVHLPHTGRRSQGGRARTLSIGCRNIWAQRGIRFDWTHADDLDVTGPVLYALPFDSDSFREIYVENRLNGLAEEGMDMFAEEAWRVLRHGGRLTIYGRDLAVKWLKAHPGWAVRRADPTQLDLRAVKE